MRSGLVKITNPERLNRIMEIEIVTTKKKLTKSIVNQMPVATLQAVRWGEPLGYMVNARTKMYHAVLILYDSKYYVIPMNYQKGELSVYRKVGKWSQSKKFETAVDCDQWWEYYQVVLKAVEERQIYI